MPNQLTVHHLPSKNIWKSKSFKQEDIDIIETAIIKCTRKELYYLEFTLEDGGSITLGEDVLKDCVFILYKDK